jgi:hypothetical protein
MIRGIGMRLTVATPTAPAMIQPANMPLELHPHHGERAHTNWEVRQVHFQELGADEPFAGSAPVA